MGISPQTYRARIGYFHSIKIKVRNTSKPVSKYNKMGQSCVCFKIFSVMILMLCTNMVILNNISNINHNHNNDNSHNRCVKLSHFEGYQNYGSSTVLGWTGLSVNKIQKIINGNRRSVGYRLAVWNCARGLVQDGFSHKLHEIKQFITEKKPQCFGIIESDFYGHDSQVFGVKKYTTNEIREKLNIDGYKIEFPQTWDSHGQARLICYVSESLKYTRKKLNESHDHIPSITLEIGLGKATRTTVHYYYREWKNGVTGQDDASSQLTHLKHHISQWEEIANTGRNFVTTTCVPYLGMKTTFDIKIFLMKFKHSSCVKLVPSLSISIQEYRRLEILSKDHVWITCQQTLQKNAMFQKSLHQDPVIIFQ